MKSTKYAILDLDMFLFRVAWQVDRLGLAKTTEVIRNMMRTWVPKGFKPIGTLSDARWRNFRRLYWPDYKLNREGFGGPKSLRDIRNNAYSGTSFPFPVLYQIGAEADDLMSILMYENPDSVIVSCDKDMLQVPGMHYHPLKKQWTTVTPEEGRKKLLLQWVQGDMGDHVPGVYKHGPKAAEDLISYDNPEEIILLRYYLTHDYNPYPKLYNMTWHEYALAMYRCVRLCTSREELNQCISLCPSMPKTSRVFGASSTPGATKGQPISSPQLLESQDKDSLLKQAETQSPSLLPAIVLDELTTD